MRALPDAARRILAILSKELIQLRRDRTTLGMVIMIPLIPLMLFGYAINTNVRNIPVALVDQANTGLSRVLTQAVEATQVVRFTERYVDIPAARDAIVAGRVRAALIIPPDLSQRIARSGSVGAGLASPPSTDEQTSRPVAIVRETERGNMEMLINTPVRPLELMLGKIVPYIGIGLVQTRIILLLGHLIFGVPLHGSLLALAVATLAFIGASLALGLVLSTIASSQLQAMQMTVFILLPSILLSGFMFPYEGMPVPAQYIAELLPATHFMRAIRAVMLRDAAVIQVARDSLWLLGFTLVGLLIASLRFKKRLD